MAVPSSETCTSGPSADCAALIRFLASSEVTSSEGLSQVTRAKATVPDRLICVAPCGPYGLATLSTPGTAAALASAAVTADRTAADRTAEPRVAWITI
jgi:hypothetical protein